MTATWGRETSRGITKAVLAAFFAIALVFAMAAPAALADEHDAESGFYIGEVVEVNVDDQWIEAAVVPVSEDLFDELEENWEEEEIPEEAPVFRFDVHETDELLVNMEPQDEKEDFLLAAQASIGEDHLIFIGYQTEEEDQSLFALFTDADDENGNGNGGTETDDDEEHREPVERAERVETGAGGTAPGGLGGLALLLGMVTVAGATFLRKASETS